MLLLTDVSILFFIHTKRVIFGTTRGNGWQGHIALDEISLSYQKCLAIPKLQPRSCGQKGRGLSDITKIVGGQNAYSGEWPWQVALMDEKGIFCGGSLVSNHYVITAAHCVEHVYWSGLKVISMSQKYLQSVSCDNTTV